MFRALFTAVGITVAMLGLECMVIDKAILAQSGNQTALASNKEWVPPEWAPWTLLSGGVIVVLYSFTIPKRMNG